MCGVKKFDLLGQQITILTREGNWKRQNFFQKTKYSDKSFLKRDKVWETFYTLFQKIVNLYCNLVNHFFIINHAPDHFWYETWLKTIYYKYIGKGIHCEVVRFCVSLEVVLFFLETKLVSALFIFGNEDISQFSWSETSKIGQRQNYNARAVE